MNIFKYIQRSKWFACKIKQGLIVNRRTSIPLSGIFRVIFCCKGRCPTGTKFFPFGLVVCQYFGSVFSVFVIYLNRQPCRFPIHNADSGIAYICNSLDNAADFICLTLNTKTVSDRCIIIIADSYGVIVTVTVIQSVCP